ncbi:hypothetical protein DL93DRAFT_43520 [Clavulina sp. PMI_390]|nr:hypothetical protein DL93DRAFT_43520 [Clavulina sp. PMI_390]
MAQPDPTVVVSTTSKQYAPIANIPIIKSPSLRTPVPIPIPVDVHPLPDNVNAYFVYPFTLEPHVLTLESSRQSTFQAHSAKNAAYLRSREEEKIRRKREALHRIAPGFEPSAGTLVPTKIALRPSSVSIGSPPPPPPLGSIGAAGGASAAPRDVMDDLVDQLAALDSAKRS